MDFSKMLKEKLRSYLNFTGTPHVADPKMGWLRWASLQVVVFGLSLLAVYEVAGAEYFRL
jgi:hypothetical protein